MLLDKLKEILNFKLKSNTLKVQRNRLNSWQTEWDPGVLKSSKTIVNRSDSTKFHKKKPLLRFQSDHPINQSALDPMSPKPSFAEGMFSSNYESKPAKSQISRKYRNKSSDQMKLEVTASEVDDGFAMSSRQSIPYITINKKSDKPSINGRS